MTSWNRHFFWVSQKMRHGKEGRPIIHVNGTGSWQCADDYPPPTSTIASQLHTPSARWHDLLPWCTQSIHFRGRFFRACNVDSCLHDDHNVQTDGVVLVSTGPYTLVLLGLTKSQRLDSMYVGYFLSIFPSKDVVHHTSLC